MSCQQSLKLRMLFAFTLAMPAFASNGMNTFDAITQASHDVELAFTIPGRISSVLVKPGSTVKAGQVLVELDHEAHKHLLDISKLKINSNTDEKIATQRLLLAILEEEDANQQYTNRATSANKQKKTKTQIHRKLAELELARVKEHRLREEQNLKRLLAHQAQYKLRAEYDGTIETVTVSAGTHIKPGKPIVRLVNYQTIQIHATIPTEKTHQLNIGDAALIQASGQHQPIQGRIIHLSKIIDHATDTRHVHIQIENNHGLLVGSHVRLLLPSPHDSTASTKPQAGLASITSTASQREELPATKNDRHRKVQ